MKKLLLIALLFASTQAFSNTSEHYQLVMKFHSVLQAEKLVEANIEEMIKVQRYNFEKLNLAPEKMDLVEQFFRKQMEMFHAAMTKPANMQKIYGAYMEVYSVEELKAFIAFFTSDMGKKYIAKQTELSSLMTEVLQKETSALMPKLMKMQRELQRQINQ